MASEDPSLAAKASTYVQALVALDQFSGSVLIGREDQVLFTSGYGLANREHGVANTPQTKFRLGSVTKQFTAMAVLILQGQGKLRVHDPVTKVLPDCPQAWERVTIQHLLTHTSGIPEHTNGLDWKTTGRAPHTPKGVIDLFRERPLDFQPGEAHQYSNSGYVLLGHIIEQVADAPYEAFLQEHVLGPLGMANTGYDSSGRVLEHRATGYDLRAGTFVNAEYLDMSIPHAAGALYSTVEDLFLWDRALYTDQLVPRASLEAMFMVNPLLANYGYGVVVGQQFGRRLIGHAGGIHGFLTYLGRYPTERVCVAVLSNLTATKVTDVARVLAAIVFGEEYSVPEERIRTVLAPGICASYAGEYQFAPGVVLSVDAEDQQLNATGSAGGRGVFLPESETCFCRKGSDDRMTFFRDEAGKVSHLVLTQEGVEVRADRIR